MCKSNFHDAGIYSCQLEFKNAFKLNMKIWKVQMKKSNICTFLCFGIYTFRKMFDIMCVKAESGGWKIFAMLAWVNIISDI